MNMFDWLQPPKTKEDNKDDDDATTTKKKEQPNNFFGNMFNQGGGGGGGDPTKEEDGATGSSSGNEKDVKDQPKDILEKKEQEPVVVAAVASTQTATPASSGKSDSVTTSTTDDGVTIHTGTVEWFDRNRGFGFIRPSSEDGKEEQHAKDEKDGDKKEKTNNPNNIFVHHSDLQIEHGYRFLFQGEIVCYQVGKDETNGKSRATKVTGEDGQELWIAQIRRREWEENQKAAAAAGK